MTHRRDASHSRTMFPEKVQQLTDRSSWIWSVEKRNAQLASYGTVVEVDGLDASQLQGLFNRQTGSKANAESGLHRGNYAFGGVYVDTCAKLLAQNAIPFEIFLNKLAHARPYFSKQDRLLNQFRSSNRLFFRQAMIRSHNERQLILSECFNL